MRLTKFITERSWIAFLVLALGYVAWSATRQAARLEALTALGDSALAVDAGSPTGYAGGLRRLIVPGHNNESYQWIMQAQWLLREGSLHMRQADYDNAPQGRAIVSPSPYRWWLACVAWSHHRLTGLPVALSVERAAIWADPLLQGLLLLGATILSAQAFGCIAALATTAGVLALYPASGSFLAGTPDDFSLIQSGLTLMMLALLGGVHAATCGAKRPMPWFIAGGIMGGIGLWISVGTFTWAILGLAAGAVLNQLLARWPGGAWLSQHPLPWRSWAWAGGTTALAAWMLENAPDRLTLLPPRLEAVHPLYSAAWIGLGEILHVVGGWSRREPPGNLAPRLIRLISAVAALVAIPVLMKTRKTPAFLQPHAYAEHVTGGPDGFPAGNFAKWVTQAGPTAAVLAAVLSLGILLVALYRLLDRGTTPGERTGIILGGGPVLVCLSLAFQQLGWWNQAGALLISWAAALAAGRAFTGNRRWFWLLGACLALLPGLAATFPQKWQPDDPRITQSELESLVERDLAHRLAHRVGPDGANCLAPPNLAAVLAFHGGLKVLGSPYHENEDGFRASIRIAGATSADEAFALINQRKVTHIIVPTWDKFLDEYARLGANQIDQTLMGLLHQWLPPRWLRPVSFNLPRIPGFEDQSVAVFEVTDVQDNALETGRLDLAIVMSKTLGEAFASDLGAQAARAHTDLARRNLTAFREKLGPIVAGIESGQDENLAWERRVSLALILAQGGRQDLARAQTTRCLDEMGEYDLRGLSAPRLQRFLALCASLGLRIPDPDLASLAPQLLPPEFRGKQ